MIDFMGKRKALYLISGILFALAIVALGVFGLRPGIDFTGGSLIEVAYPSGKRPTVEDVQKTLTPLNLGTILVQPAGDDSILFRLRFVNEEEHQRILDTLRGGQVSGGTSGTGTATTSVVTGDLGIQVNTKNTTDIVEKRFETIGGTVSSQLRNRSVSASIGIILVIIFFIAYAFRKVSRPIASWKYGVTAVVAMIHDVVITVGVFAVLGKFFHIEIDIPFIVAMLTVFGYSVNDTIVVFDRIRENLVRKGSADFPRLVNAAINETLARSINTSVTTLIVLFSLFLLGGDTIRYFSLALLIGIFLGTYSSIFVASALLVSWNEWIHKKRA